MTDLAVRYREALLAWEASGEYADRPPSPMLDAIEREILAGADLGDGIDPVLMMALDIYPPDLGAEGFRRRGNQIAAESGEETIVWVADRTRATHERRTSVAAARLALVVALDAIEQAAKDATEALDKLDRWYDPAMITPRRGDRGVRFAMIEQALYQVRLGRAAAQDWAPDPESIRDL